jgi:hypothetical protein
MADGMMPDTLAMLAEPFPPEAISWRLGSTTKDKSKGMPLAYIDARDVMDRLDGVCGPGGWQCEYVPMANGTTCCRIGLRLSGEWVWKSNGGSATGDVDNEKEREMAEKGGYSDAFKRAAVLWGVGRYLYGMSAPWVKIEPRGASHVMVDGEQDKLDAWYRKFIKQVSTNAPRADAGLRETPREEKAAGAGSKPPPPAPASPPANDLDGEEVDQTTQPEWPILESEMEDYSTREDLKAWWTNPENKKLKERKPHFMRAFYRGPFAVRWNELGETVVYEDEPGAQG